MKIMDLTLDYVYFCAIMCLYMWDTKFLPSPLYLGKLRNRTRYFSRLKCLRQRFLIRTSLIIIPFLLFGCTIQSDTEFHIELPEITLPFELDEIIEVKDWIALGPFSFNTRKQAPQNTFLNEDLAKYKIDEDNFLYDDISKINRKDLAPFMISQTNGFIKLFDYAGEMIEDKSNFYLCSSIFSPIEREVTLIVDGSNSYKLWFNQQTILNVTRKHNTNKVGDRFVNVKLKKGSNLLFVKVNRGSNVKSWGFVLGISSVSKAKEVYINNYFSDFIQNPIITDSIQIYTGPYSDCEIQIMDEGNNLIIKDTVTPYNINVADANFTVSGLSTLENGFYNCRLYFAEDSIEEFFYKGNYIDLIEKIDTDIRDLEISEKEKNDLQAGLQRVSFLSNEEVSDFSSSEIRILNKNRVYWAKAIKESVSYAETTKSLRGIAGTSLRTYTSNKSDRIYHFVFHVGNNVLLKPKIPLIIAVPYALEGESMTEDWYLSNLDQIEIDNKMADDHGFAIVWVYMGGKSYTPQIGREDVISVIERIRESYDIDTTQIYVLGDCEGGRRALLLVERNPDLFSGIAVTSPITSFDYWNEAPINYVENLYNVPIVIEHGENDEVSTVENSRQFVADALNSGYSPKYIETKNSHLTFSKDYRRYAFIFFDSINNVKKNDPPEIIKYSTLEAGSLSVYWIEINKIDSFSRATIIAKYNSNSNVFNIDYQNLDSYKILSDKLKLTKDTYVTVCTNDTLIFKGNLEETKVFSHIRNN
mgnify:CR=1 FL=1